MAKETESDNGSGSASTNGLSLECTSIACLFLKNISFTKCSPCSMKFFNSRYSAK